MITRAWSCVHSLIQGTHVSYADNLRQLLDKEQEQGIKPDPVIDAYMKASAAGKAKHSIVADYMIKVVCQGARRKYVA